MACILLFLPRAVTTGFILTRLTLTKARPGQPCGAMPV